jgi:hypothetical protein
MALLKPLKPQPKAVPQAKTSTYERKINLLAKLYELTLNGICMLNPTLLQEYSTGDRQVTIGLHCLRVLLAGSASEPISANAVTW